MSYPAVDLLNLSDHDSKPEHEIDPEPVPVVDAGYQPAVHPPLPVHDQPLRGQPRGRPRLQLLVSLHLHSIAMLARYALFTYCTLGLLY